MGVSVFLAPQNDVFPFGFASKPAQNTLKQDGLAVYKTVWRGAFCVVHKFSPRWYFCSSLLFNILQGWTHRFVFQYSFNILQGWIHRFATSTPFSRESGTSWEVQFLDAASIALPGVRCV